MHSKTAPWAVITHENDTKLLLVPQRPFSCMAGRWALESGLPNPRAECAILCRQSATTWSWCRDRCAGAVGIDLIHVRADAALVHDQPQAGKLHQSGLDPRPEGFLLATDVFGSPAPLLHGVLGIKGHVVIQPPGFPGLSPGFQRSADCDADILQIVGGQPQFGGA